MSVSSQNALIASVNVDYARGEVSTRFFRSVLSDPDSMLLETGNVECPTGYFGIVRIDQSFRNGWKVWSGVLEDGMPEESEVPDGYYYVKKDSNGLVWALSTTSPNEAEAAVSACFDESGEMYVEWEDSDSDD